MSCWNRHLRLQRTRQWRSKAAKKPDLPLAKSLALRLPFSPLLLLAPYPWPATCAPLCAVLPGLLARSKSKSLSSRALSVRYGTIHKNCSPSDGRSVKAFGFCSKPLLLDAPFPPSSSFSLLLFLTFLLPTTEAPKIPDDFRESTWQKLQKAVNSIHLREAVDFSLEELYVVRPPPLLSPSLPACRHPYSSLPLTPVPILRSVG